MAFGSYDISHGDCGHLGTDLLYHSAELVSHDLSIGYPVTKYRIVLIDVDVATAYRRCQDPN
jgi:hypothetical protein